MTYVRTLATSTYQGGQKRIDFRPKAIKTAEQKAEQARLEQERVARRKAQQEAAQARKNFKGHVTAVSPTSGWHDTVHHR